jgi:hypothetical protein
MIRKRQAIIIKIFPDVNIFVQEHFKNEPEKSNCMMLHN